MPFSLITLGVLITTDDAHLLVTWPAAGAGAAYQVYVNRSLAWRGYATRAALPYPQGTVEIDVGSCLASEIGDDFSGLLPPPVGDNYAELSWLGGTYLDSAIQAFHVYGSAAPGGAVNRVAPLAVIPAYVGPISDGFGQGGFGQGGFGLAASSYEWTSGFLAPGVWTFVLTVVDTAGNESAGQTVVVVTTGPPGEPAAFPDGTRVHKSFNPITGTVTLNWQAPSYE